MCLETITEINGSLTWSVQVLYYELPFLGTCLKINVLQTLNVFGDNSWKSGSLRSFLFGFYTMNYSSWEHIKMISVSQTLTVFGNNSWKIFPAFILWITVLGNVVTNQCFPDPECVCKQYPKKLVHWVHLSRFL